MKFLLGDCSFSTMACEYSHRKEDAPLCRRWQKGLCIGAVGNTCKFRHFYNENDKDSLQGRQSEELGLRQVVNYSSPYKVKILREVSRQRKEEVDLETGRRRSWVETTEFDVFDLTGDTPVKQIRSLAPRSPSISNYCGISKGFLGVSPDPCLDESVIIISPSSPLPRARRTSRRRSISTMLTDQLRM